VTHVAEDGTVLFARNTFPVDEVLVGVEVLVNEGDACTQVTGFETYALRGAERFMVKGSYDATADNICTQVAPAPVAVVLPVRLHIQNLSVGPNRENATKTIEVGGNLYRVRYLRSTGEVSVLPLMP
ncbi:hypothetical protein K2X33_08670, partial [bacterium]|nr:hypothetical protein [bacterium]